MIIYNSSCLLLNYKMDDVELLGNYVIKKIRQSRIGDIIIKKGKILSENDQRKIGDRMIEFAEKYGIKYMSITTASLFDEEITSSTSLFPVNLYKDSFKALEEVLNRPCQRKEDHQHRGDIDIKRTYSTIELWTPLYKSSFISNIMASSSRIFSLAESVECPYEILDYQLSDNIVDCVNTNESLGWDEPPERRKYFVEDGKYEQNDPIEGHEESEKIWRADSQWILFGESAGSINFFARSDNDLFSKGQSSLDEIYDDLSVEKHLEILENWLQETEKDYCYHVVIF